MKKDIINLPDLKLLSDEETRNFLQQVKQGDKRAFDTLIEHNLRLVLKITYRFKNTQYDLQDLFQIGVIGLIKAVNGFDLKRKVKFSTYAVHCILGEIKVNIRDGGIVKVSRNLKKIARIVRKKEEEFKQVYNREPTLQEISEYTDYNKKEILQALEANKYPVSIYHTVQNENGQKLTLLNSLEDKDSNNGIGKINRITLYNIINNLEERERKIIFLRYFKEKTQAEIGKKIGISQVQVSRLEKKILKQLRNQLYTHHG